MRYEIDLKFLLSFCFFSCALVACLEADEASGSNNYRERFGKSLPPEREEPAEKGKEKDRGTKGGKAGKKKEKNIVSLFSAEDKAHSKVFLEVEHGEIIASSYTGFTKLEPAWEPIAWSPIADSWDRDSLGTSVQTALIEGNGFTVVENGILWSPDGHHSSVPEIGQDLGLGETGVLLLGFAGQLSIYNSAHTILSSAKILTPGAIAAATGRALSAATRLAPRVAHRATPAAIISAPGFIILDTVTRPRGPYCPVCVPAHHYRMPHTNIVPNQNALPGEIGYDTGKPDAVEPDGRTWPFHALGIYLAPGVYKWYGWVGTEKGIKLPGLEPKPNNDGGMENLDELVTQIVFDNPGIIYKDLIQKIANALGIGYEVAERMYRKWLEDSLKSNSPKTPEGPTPPTSNGILPPPILLPIISEDDREQIRESLGIERLPPPSFRYYVNQRGSRNAMRHHVSPVN